MEFHNGKIINTFKNIPDIFTFLVQLYSFSKQCQYALSFSELMLKCHHFPIFDEQMTSVWSRSEVQLQSCVLSLYHNRIITHCQKVK